jgi:hypothetical protein
MTKAMPIQYARHLVSPALDAVEARLLEAGTPLFQMNGALVEMIRLNARQAKAEEEATGIKRPAGSLVIKTVNHYRLLEIMMRDCVFACWSEKREKFVAPSAVPLDFAKHFDARGMWNLRVLRGIVEAPTLRADGTVVSAPGYDEASGLYLDTGGVVFPQVADRPSREDALQGLAVLKDVIKDFPFTDGESRSVMLSAMLTTGCRKSLTAAPVHSIEAPVMASGKTLLCDSVSMVWTGRPAAAISVGASEEEFDKRVFAVLLQGDPLVLIDNVSRPLKSDEFCKVLTSETIQGRVLGASMNRQASTAVTWLVNGNNLVFEGDIRTRVLVGRIDAGMENPGERRFDRDLRTWIPENRGMLVAAALTVLRAFVVAGRPGLDALPPFGRFEQWSNLVRGALAWLGEADPYATHQAAAATDPEQAGLSMLIEAWGQVVEDGRWVTASELISACLGDGGTALADALDTVSTRREPKVLGKYLVRVADRIVAGRCIRKQAKVGRSAQFRLEDHTHVAGQPSASSSF